MNLAIAISLLTTLLVVITQVEGQTTDCIPKGEVCTRTAIDWRPCCNSQGPPCPPNTRTNCRFIRCRERYGQKQWHWYCLHWNYYMIYSRSMSPMDDFEEERPSKYISGGGMGNRRHKISELQQQIIEQLNRIADKLESKVPKPAAAPEAAPAPEAVATAPAAAAVPDTAATSAAAGTVPAAAGTVPAAETAGTAPEAAPAAAGA